MEFLPREAQSCPAVGSLPCRPSALAVLSSHSLHHSPWLILVGLALAHHAETGKALRDILTDTYRREGGWGPDVAQRPPQAETGTHNNLCITLYIQTQTRTECTVWHFKTCANFCASVALVMQLSLSAALSSFPQAGEPHATSQMASVLPHRRPLSDTHATQLPLTWPSKADDHPSLGCPPLAAHSKAAEYKSVVSQMVNYDTYGHLQTLQSKQGHGAAYSVNTFIDHHDLNLLACSFSKAPGITRILLVWLIVDRKEIGLSICLLAW